MDTLTQMALGAAIGDAAFSKRMGNRAVLFGASMGLLPDLDLSSRFMGDWSSLMHHRGYSHSLVILPLIVPLLGWLGWRWDRKRNPWLAWTLLAAIALLTHPLLDACTSYGTMLFVPITWNRYAIDAVGIIDAIYTIPLLVALAASWRLRMSRKSWGWFTGQRVAAAALALTTTYLAVDLGITQIVKARARTDLMASGFVAERIRATPPPFFTPNRHVVATDGAGNVAVSSVSLWSDRPYTFTRRPRSDGPLGEKALASHEGEIFTWFADGFVTARTEPDTGSTSVRLDDHRYGMVTDPAWSPFSVLFTFDPDGNQTASLLRHGRDLDVRAELTAAWRLMWGRDG